VKWVLDFDSKLDCLQVEGNIEEGWHLYSIKTDPNAGPIPVQIKSKKARGIKIVSEFVEKTAPAKIFDANFDSDVYIFEKKYFAEQKIKLKKETFVEVTVTYMICNDQMCLPPIDEILSIKLNVDE
jgi:thiol:disulfide interchange protein DsbD